MISNETTSESNLDLFSQKFFEDFASNHSWEPGWLADLRKESWAKLQETQNSVLKEESWRFSPKNRFEHTDYKNTSDSSQAPKITLSGESSEVVCDSVDNIILENPDLFSVVAEENGPCLGASQCQHLINTYFESGFFIKVPTKQGEVSQVKIDHTSPQTGKVTFRKNLIILEDFAELTLIENFCSENHNFKGGVSNLSHFKLGKGAKLNRILIQNMIEGTSFHNLENFNLHANSSVINMECYLGASQSRIETKGNLIESGCSFENYSFVLGKNQQIFDQRTEQHHISPHCSSNLLSKNVLQDESKSIFSGLIRVDADAQQTNALQTNRNLLLSKQAKADSLPGLEILANDVKCTHGATTSRINQEELFYLLSRGIAKKNAESLISLGFLEEIIGKIKNEKLVMEIRENVRKQFNISS